MLFQDEHLLVVNKPAGLNTHAPSPLAGEGIYEWLRDRDPRWSSLAIIHRLDKETSGVMVFGLSTLANRSLTAQFSSREVTKRYLLLTDRLQTEVPARCRSCIQRAGDKYVSRPIHAGGDVAETEFRKTSVEEWPLFEPGASPLKGTQLIEAVPLTGRTHQIRVHAAEAGIPILGDGLYGGTPSTRVFLHAAEIGFLHPLTNAAVKFTAPFRLEPAGLQLRHLLIDPKLTSAYRLVHGASDGWPGLYIDRLGDHLLLQSGDDPDTDQLDLAARLKDHLGSTSVYHRRLTRHARGRGTESSPTLLLGTVAPATFPVLENGLSYELSLHEGYSVGLFLDQRENRGRLLTGHIGAGFDFQSSKGSGSSPLSPGTARSPGAPIELLNNFAYTCAFSVAAAKLGIRTTSLDLSKKYLEWGKRNFQLNQIDPSKHDFIFGDVFDWIKRLDRKGRRFDIIVLDPPTFSQSRESGVFRAEEDYAVLATEAIKLLNEPGILLASTNAAKWDPEDFVRTIRTAARESGRKIVRERFVPQPPDFPITRSEPGYLKTFWLELAGSGQG